MFVMWVWVKIKNHQQLDRRLPGPWFHLPIGQPFWGYPIFDPQPCNDHLHEIWTSYSPILGFSHSFFSTIVLFPWVFHGFLKRFGSLERMQMDPVPIENWATDIGIYLDRPADHGMFFLLFFPVFQRFSVSYAARI